MKLPPLLALGAVVIGFFLAGCDYDLPATPGPTRPVEPKLLGDWTSVDPEDHKEIAMHVRKLDDFNYAVSVEADIYRVFHSDLDPLPLLSVQDLNSTARKYVLYRWKLSDDATQLTLLRVSTDVISDQLTETSALQAQLIKHAADPKLLGRELSFTRAKKTGFGP